MSSILELGSYGDFWPFKLGILFESAFFYSLPYLHLHPRGHSLDLSAGFYIISAATSKANNFFRWWHVFC